MSGNNVFAVVYKYHTLGRCVIPSGGGDKRKKALIPWTPYQTRKPDDMQLEKWQRELKPEVWAMVTGPVSGLFVVDCDTKEAIAMMEAAGIKPHAKTPRGGYHYYCKWPSWVIPTKAGLLPGVDTRGQGGYVNFCGGNGKASYQVLIMPTDESLITFGQLPAELQKPLKPKPKTLTERIYQEALDRAQPGNRNETGLWLACQLRDNHISEADAETTMRRYAAEVSDLGTEPYTENEAIASLHQAFTRPAREAWHPTAPAPETGQFNLTELGNAERLVAQYGDILRYCYERRKWLIWNGKYWQWDAGNKITKLAKQTVRNIYREAADEPDEKLRKAIADHARRSENDHRLSAMVTLAQSETGVPITIDELDADQWLLNVNNGTINLRTGELRSHDPKDLITRIVSLDYTPNAISQVWQDFLSKIFEGNQELISYVHRALGYSITGDQGEQAFFFCHGAGWNGKSTLLGAIQDVLGPYVAEADPSAFMVSKNQSPGPNETIAELYKIHMVCSTEVEDGQRLSTTLIKRMTGGEELRCERKYEHGFNFLPQYKLWLSGNHEPVITDTTNSIWNRLKKIPFTVTIPENERIKNFRKLLSKEHGQAILAWLVNGCLEWAQHGLGEPPVITEATQHYRESQDILLEFLTESCIRQPSASIIVADLYKAYKQWCDDNSSYAIGKNTFSARLKEKGFITDRGSRNKLIWKGIRLMTEEEKVTSVTSVTDFAYLSFTKGIQEKGKEKEVTKVTKITEPKDSADVWAGMPDRKGVTGNDNPVS